MAKQTKRDVSIWVAGGILQELKEGRDQRVSLYLQEFDRLTGNITSMISNCHNAPLIVKKVRRTKGIVCSKCMMPCTPIEKFNLNVVTTRLNVIKELLQEDVELSKFMERMNFSFPSNPLLDDVVDEGKKFVKSTDITPTPEQELIDTYDKLPPMDREKILKRLERNVLSDGRSVKDGET